MSWLGKHFALLLISQLVLDASALPQTTDHQSVERYRAKVRTSKGHHDLSSRQERTSSSQNRARNIKKKGPFLTLTSNNTRIEAQTGTTAILPCEIKEIDAARSWVKLLDNNDFVLLTVNESTYSNDKRFYVSPQNWSLYIRYAEKRDEGRYECQVCAQPTSSILINLKLIEAYADIFGVNPKVVKANSPLRLSCVLRHAKIAPEYIFWYRDDRMINFDLADGAAVRDGRLGSELIFPSAQPEHSGNYSCVPSNARQASVIVDVEQSSEKPTPTKLHGRKNGSGSPKRCIATMMLLLILTSLAPRRHSGRT